MTQEPPALLDRDGCSLAYRTLGVDADRFFLLQPFWQGMDEVLGPGTLARRLARYGSVLVHDRRGTGASLRVPADLSLDAMLADLRALLSQVGWARATLVAIAEAAPLAVQFAVRYPERIDKIVLLDPTLRPITGPGSTMLVHTLRKRPEIGLQAFARTLVATDAEAATLAERFAEHLEGPIAARLYGAFLDMNGSSVLNAVRAPTLFVSGVYDRLVSDDEVRMLTGLMPTASAARVSDAAGSEAALAEAWTRLAEFIGLGSEPPVAPAWTADTSPIASAPSVDAPPDPPALAASLAAAVTPALAEPSAPLSESSAAPAPVEPADAAPTPRFTPLHVPLTVPEQDAPAPVAAIARLAEPPPVAPTARFVASVADAPRATTEPEWTADPSEPGLEAEESERPGAFQRMLRGPMALLRAALPAPRDYVPSGPAPQPRTRAANRPLTSSPAMTPAVTTGASAPARGATPPRPILVAWGPPRDVPEEAIQLNRRGIDKLLLGEIEAALTCFQEAMDLAPHYEDAAVNHRELLSRLVQRRVLEWQDKVAEEVMKESEKRKRRRRGRAGDGSRRPALKLALPFGKSA